MKIFRGRSGLVAYGYARRFLEQSIGLGKNKHKLMLKRTSE